MDTINTTIFSLLVLFSTFSHIEAQENSNKAHNPVIEGEFIVQLSEKANVQNWIEQLSEIYPEIQADHIRPLSHFMNIHLIRMKSDELSPQFIRSTVRNLRFVIDIFPNREGSWRGGEPDDPLYPDQWNLQAIMAPEAWEIARGGVTSLGDTIVIAVMDSGCQIDHPDLYPNIWVNRSEIPGNGIDDDGNGYIDDYYGLNITTGNDQHNATNHGTQVIGAAGAVTNNSEGIAGINWNVKIMVLSKSGTGPTEADMVEAYSYVIDQRKRYNESNGEEGAFVVAINFSGGIANAIPDSFPLWCGMYDLMGQVGILSTAATVNSNTNVDVFGDIPTACPSPYLISVTNSDMDDRKFSNAGYGQNSIDLAAPGRSVPTTNINDGYSGGINGTSISAPQVAAAVALLYSADCMALAELARSNPSEAALAVKRAIMDGVDKNEDLEQYTISGGRLNLYNSLFKLQDCQIDLGELSIVNIYPNPTFGDINIQFLTPDFEDYEIQVTDILGRRVFKTSFKADAFQSGNINLNLEQLQSGTYLIHIIGANRKSSRKFIKF